MFFENSQISRNLELERALVTEFIESKLKKENEYPIYVWRTYNLANGSQLSKPEALLTTNFDDFLNALESLRYSSSMHTLALVVKNQIQAQFRVDLNTAARAFGALHVDLLKKKVALLQSDVANKMDLAQEVDALIAHAKENLETFQVSMKEKQEKLEAAETDYGLGSSSSTSPSR